MSVLGNLLRDFDATPNFTVRCAFTVLTAIGLVGCSETPNAKDLSKGQTIGSPPQSANAGSSAPEVAPDPNVLTSGGSDSVSVDTSGTQKEMAPLIGSVDSQGRKLVWQDEFEGTSLDLKKWRTDENVLRQNKEEQTFTNSPENIRVMDGKLIITTHYDARGTIGGSPSRFTSSRIRTIGPEGHWMYGRIEAKILMPGGLGNQPSFFMLPDDERVDFPKGGAFYIAQQLENAKEVFATAHTNGSLAKSRKQFQKKIALEQAATKDFHVYRVDWDKDQIEFFVDDKSELKIPRQPVLDPKAPEYSWPFDSNFDILLSVPIGPYYESKTGIAEDQIDGKRMIVDYVRVYQR